MEVSRTVLLIDDNDELRDATGDLLAALGYRVVAVARSAQALATIDAGETVDLVVADVAMAGMGGSELTSELLSRRRDLGVVLMSSGDLALHPGLGRGRVRFLRKPFSARELEAAAEDALARAASAPASAGAPRAAEPADARRPRRLAPAWGLAAAALLVVAAGAVLRSFELAPPPLPDVVTAGVTRGAVLELVAPLGELAAMPAELRWREVDGAASYRVRVLGVDEVVLWEAAATAGGAALPAELAGSLHPGVVYLWQVEALDAAGKVLARSGRERFRVRPARGQ